MTILKTISRHKVKVTISLLIVFLFFQLRRNDLKAKQGLNDPTISPPPTGNVADDQTRVEIGSKPLKDPPEIVQIKPQKPENEALVRTEGEEAADTIRSWIKDYSIFFKNLGDYAIDAPSLKDNYKSEHAAEKFSTVDNFLFSKEYLEVLDIAGSTLKKLKDSHSRFTEVEMKRLLDEYKLSTFGNTLKTDPEWSQYQGSKGYVLIGGGQYSWLSYLVIRQIRATGAKLPIELFIATDDEYETEFCDELLPKFNARCNLFDTSLSKQLNEKFNIGGYQYKMLALLSSKFENVLYMDSDNFPVRNVDYLFESKLYQEKGLILWPDAWARTTNPNYYDIAGLHVAENKVRYSRYDEKLSVEKGGQLRKPDDYNFKNSWFHGFEGTLPDPTSEAGMLLVNKTSHLRTLLLALYYNVFGPNFYYPLLTQGSAGEGDKETFIAAAHAMNEPWFQTLKQFRWTGYHSEESGEFKSKSLSHHDPEQSLQFKDTDKEIDLVFMHLSYPKYYPSWLVDNNDLVYASSGNHIRMYSSVYDNIGYDFDLRVLQFFTQALCPNYYNSDGSAVDGQEGLSYSQEYMGKYLDYVKTDQDIELERCEKVFIPHLKWLKETTKHPDSSVVIDRPSF